MLGDGDRGSLFLVDQGSILISLVCRWWKYYMQYYQRQV